MFLVLINCRNRIWEREIANKSTSDCFSAWGKRHFSFLRDEMQPPDDIYS